MKKRLLLLLTIGIFSTQKAAMRPGSRRLISPRVAQLQSRVLSCLEPALTNPEKATRRYSTQKVQRSALEKIESPQKTEQSLVRSAVTKPSHLARTKGWLSQQWRFGAVAALQKEQFILDMQTKKRLRKRYNIDYSNKSHFLIDFLSSQILEQEKIDHSFFAQESSALLHQLKSLSPAQRKQMVKAYHKPLALIVVQMTLVPSRLFVGGVQQKMEFLELLARAGLTNVQVPAIKKGVLYVTNQLDWSQSMSLADFLSEQRSLLPAKTEQQKAIGQQLESIIEQIKKNSSWWSWW